MDLSKEKYKWALDIARDVFPAMECWLELLDYGNSIGIVFLDKEQDRSSSIRLASNIRMNGRIIKEKFVPKYKLKGVLDKLKEKYNATQTNSIKSS